jgi:carbon monoxide dehydrogenase subunit G
MRLQRRVDIDADRETIWKRVSDPASYPDFMANLERWDEVTEGPAVSVRDTPGTGKSDRYPSAA